MLKCRTNSCNFFKSYLISAKKSSFNNFYSYDRKFVSDLNDKSIKSENIFTYLNERNLISCISNPELLTNIDTVNSFFKDDPKLYIGFDPTAESLHLGNLIGILTSLRFLGFGINPIFLIGGATGLIGEPSGKNKERPLLNKDKVGKNLNLIESDLVSLMEQIENNSDFMH